MDPAHTPSEPASAVALYSIKRHGRDLPTCDSEPIHRPGCIQDHGVLLVLRRTDQTIVQVSENSARLLSRPPAELVGLPVASLTGAEIAERIADLLQRATLDHHPVQVATLPAGEKHGAFALTLHVSGAVALLEFEPLNGIPDDTDYIMRVNHIVSRLRIDQSVELLCQDLTDSVYDFLGMDRVMMYRFHADCSGEVIAESKQPQLESWLGLNYPASDIPLPAREIFKKIWIRPVVDCQAHPAELWPLVNGDDGKAPDMTHCALRGASLMYCDYLQNMGGRSSLTMSIRRNNELWGFINCHNLKPKTYSFQMRNACELLAQVASQLLKSAAEREHLAYGIRMESIHQQLVMTASASGGLSALTRGLPSLMDGLNCGGAALLHNGTWHCVGATPTEPQLHALAAWLDKQIDRSPPAQTVFQSSCLDADYPPAKAYTDIASGLLAVPLCRETPGWMMWFRPEVVTTVRWAGNPHEKVGGCGANDHRPRSRTSFTTWLEPVYNRSQAWQAAEVDAALRFRIMLLELIVGHSHQLTQINLKLKRKQLALHAHKKRLYEAQERMKDAMVAGQVIPWSYDIDNDQISADANIDVLFSCDRLHSFYHPAQSYVQRIDRPDQFRVLRAMVTAIRTEQAFVIDFRLTGPSERWLMLRGRVERQGPGGAHLVGVVLDISERKHFELELRLLKGAAEAASQAKSYFLANMSHEMRTPLSAILGFVDFLREADQPQDDRIECVDTIKRNGEQLLQLIDDVLDLSKVESGHLDIEHVEVNLADLIDSCRAVLSLAAKNKNLGLIIDCHACAPQWVVTDPTRFRQILLNVAGNAVKFTREGTVTVTVGYKPRSATGNYGAIEILVEDSGIGMTLEQAAKIWQPFAQADASTKRQFGGTGLGLTLSKRLAQKLGGDLTLQSTRPGKGSVFRFTVGVQTPMSKAMHKPDSAKLTLPQTQADHAPNVLLVDDNSDNLALIRRLLEADGAQVATAASGEEGVHRAMSEAFDVVLMDIQMPGSYDGFDAMRQLRQNGYQRGIIALTANAMRGDREQALEAGFDAYLTKPIDRSQLLQMVRSVAATPPLLH